MKICCLSIIENKETNEILMVKNKRGINKGYFNFPGGKREFDETIENSDIRESIEETGIKPLNPKTIGKIIYMPVGIEMHIYYADKFEGRLKEHNNEENDTFWIKKDQIPLDKMRSADKEWLDDALNHNKYINKRITYNEDNTYQIEDINENIVKFKNRYKALYLSKLKGKSYE